MPRLTKGQWERARAEYEVNGLSQNEIAKRFGVNHKAVQKKIAQQGWSQGESRHLVQEKAQVLKELAQVEEKSRSLPSAHQKVLEKAVRTQLELDGLRVSFHAALYHKGMELLREAETPNDWKTLTSGARDLMPQVKDGPTINVNQQQAQGQQIAPLEAMKQAIAMEEADRD